MLSTLNYSRKRFSMFSKVGEASDLINVNSLVHKYRTQATAIFRMENTKEIYPSKKWIELINSVQEG